MITVIHLAENVVLVDGLRTYELMKGQYAAMELPPRYPVPSVVGTVVIGESFIYINHADRRIMNCTMFQRGFAPDWDYVE